MYAGRSNAYEHVASLDLGTVDHVLRVCNANGEACEIIFILRHQTGMLSGLAADQCTTCLLTTFRNTLYDLSDLFGIVLSTCDIIQEKQRLAACTCHVVHAHCNAVDADRVMLVEKKRQLDLRSNAVRTGQKHRMLHVHDRCH